MSKKDQVKKFAAFLESMSGTGANPALMTVIKAGFKECYPINESIEDELPKLFGGVFSADKINEAIKLIKAGMEKVGKSDLASYIKDVMAIEPDEDFFAEIKDEFTPAAMPVTEGIGDSKLANILKLLAVSAMIASGAHAGSNDSTVTDSTKAPVEKFKDDNTSKLDDLLKNTLGADAMHYLQHKNAKSTGTAQKLGDKAKAAIGIGNEG